MFKVIIGGAALAQGALVLNQQSNFLQMGMKTRRTLATAHERAQNRASERVMAGLEASAEKAGKSFEKYITDMNQDDEDNYDDDDDLVGSDGLEHELIDNKATLSQHDFIEVHDEDEVEPEAYDGEDNASIDANDEATNFGEEGEEDN